MRKFPGSSVGPFLCSNLTTLCDQEGGGDPSTFTLLYRVVNINYNTEEQETLLKILFDVSMKINVTCAQMYKNVDRSCRLHPTGFLQLKLKMAIQLWYWIQYIGYKDLLQVSLHSEKNAWGFVYKYCRQTSCKLNFKGLERRLVAACYRYVRDNDDNQTPLTHKEHIKVGRPF